MTARCQHDCRIALRISDRSPAASQVPRLLAAPAQGLERITFVVGAATVELLRDLSRDHNEPMARVLQLGALVARRELTSRTAQG
ncbi:MAG: hypothetical protein EOO29_01280 [Comamonadaceae bacterium]|nr:MAG: hypothetical protein EOO29_01280 [Comamonadaceae bacterium]